MEKDSPCLSHSRLLSKHKGFLIHYGLTVSAVYVPRTVGYSFVPTAPESKIYLFNPGRKYHVVLSISIFVNPLHSCRHVYCLYKIFLIVHYLTANY